MMESSTSIGSQAFEFLHAEDELWLMAGFVPPPGAASLISDRSVIVFGQAGSGKTALYRALQERYAVSEGKPARLVVDWRPRLLPINISNTVSPTHYQVASVLDACSLALAEHLADHAIDVYEQVPEWAKKRLAWFLQNCGQGDLEIRFGPLLNEIPPEGGKLLERLLAQPVEDLPPKADTEWMIIELLKGLRPFGVGGIWVLCDGLENWAQADPERLARNLDILLSALSLYERSGLAFKLFLPTDLENPLRQVSGVARRRVDIHHLRWDTYSLRRLVESRLALAFGRDEFRLESLCDAPGWVEWLEWIGGNIPREWLDQVLPLARYYIENRLDHPVDERTWKRLRRGHPPHFWMDEESLRVLVGGREISLGGLPADLYEMLRLLFRRSGEIVSRDELYFLACRGLERVPRTSQDKGYEPPNDYAGMMDTKIYRLRKALEPDPSDPVLLRTVRGHGVKLVSRW